MELAQVDTAQEGDYEAPARPQSQNPNPATNPGPAPASRRQSMQSLADIVAASQRAERSGLPAGAPGARGMSLPFTPLCLTFRELSYYVVLPKVRHASCKSECLAALASGKAVGPCHYTTVPDLLQRHMK